jgi:hypothetical protein
VAHLLVIVFHDDAFEAKGPNSVEQVFSFAVDGPVNSTQLKWKPKMLAVPIFRQDVKTGDGFVTSDLRPLSYSSFN